MRGSHAHFGRVEEVDAELQRAPDAGECVVIILRTPNMRVQRCHRLGAGVTANTRRRETRHCLPKMRPCAPVPGESEAAQGEARHMHAAAAQLPILHG